MKQKTSKQNKKAGKGNTKNEIVEDEILRTEEPVNEEECENNSEESDDQDDEEPTECAIEKDEPTIPSKVKVGPVADDVPIDCIVHVNKLPKKTKVIDIVEVFAEYGPIDTVHIQEGPAACTANIAFKNAKSATAALSADKASIKGSNISVTKKQISAKKQKKTKESAPKEDARERTVYVKFLKRGTTEEQLREHFSACGDIEDVRIILKNSIAYGFVAFTEKKMVKEALKLHNSILNGSTIGVLESSADNNKVSKRDPSLTIVLKNTQNLESVEGDKLESIFEKCGEIESMDVVCRKNTLAFITFKEKEAVEKAYKLNGKKVKDISLDLEAYNPDKPKTSIFVSHIGKDVTEEDLKEHFSKSGDISSVILKKGFAIIHFKDSDGYCKSFLLNESILKGQMLFLEPHSIRKQTMLKTKNNKGTKRRSQQPNGVFSAKKTKSS
ncbi:DNA-binding protein modulo-like [Musca vetustissima]|uniref:DNA-binding protein modulo-like n=1 Tax=Musca vetustissima TaxID=27455 RepID=UPI002AB70465|nr:DNA-binding protein modulo-like [Musca vetustissima]